MSTDKPEKDKFECPFVIELGFEELPLEDLQQLVRFMAQGIVDILSYYECNCELENFRWVVTARRIGITTPLLKELVSPRMTYKHGPVISSAIVDGKWTSSGKGFLKGFGSQTRQEINPSELKEFSETDLQNITKGKLAGLTDVFISPRQDGILCLTGKQQSAPVPIQKIFEKFLEKIEQEKEFKKMRWSEGLGDCQEFIRPVRWVFSLHGNRPVDLVFCGVRSSDKTYPHRMYFGKYLEKSGSRQYRWNQPTEIQNAVEYEKSLIEVGVFPSIFSFTKSKWGDIEISERLSISGYKSRKDIFHNFMMDQVKRFWGEERPSNQSIVIDNNLDLDKKKRSFGGPRFFVGEEVLTEGFSLLTYDLPKKERPTRIREIFRQDLYDNHQMISKAIPHPEGGFQKAMAVRVGDVPYKIDFPENVLPGIQERGKRVLDARFVELESLCAEDAKNSSRMAEELRALVYQKKLGTYGERFQRVKDILEWITPHKEQFSSLAIDILEVMNVNLVSKIVDEIPNLRGKMFPHYLDLLNKSCLSNFSSDLTNAMFYDQFYSSQNIETCVGKFLRHCTRYWDKLENVLTYFATGLAPTSYSDPYRVKQEADVLIESCFHISYVIQDLESDLHKTERSLSKMSSAINEGIENKIDFPVQKLSFAIPVDYMETRKNFPMSRQKCQDVYTFLLQRLRYQVESWGECIPHFFEEGRSSFYCCDSVVTSDRDNHPWLRYSPERELNYFDVIFRTVQLVKIFSNSNMEHLIERLAMQVKRIKNITSFLEEKDFLKTPVGKGIQNCNPLVTGLSDLATGPIKSIGQDYFNPEWSKVIQKYIQGDLQGVEEHQRKGFIYLVEEIFEKVKINDEDKDVRAWNMEVLVDATAPLTRLANWELLSSHIKKRSSMENE